MVVAKGHFDIQRINENTDLRRVAETILGRPISRGQQAYNFRCPMHGEKHGASLAVYRDGWTCFGACGRGGDAVAFVQSVLHVTRDDACRYLGGEEIKHKMRISPSKLAKPLPTLAHPPTPEWQSAARVVIDQAKARLWSEDGERARAWLKSRGLANDTIKWADIGYLPGHFTQWHQTDQFVLPSGILIPWIAGAEIWGIKVRLAGGDIKYKQASGGLIRDGLYLADNICDGFPIVFTEGEFDALILYQEGAHSVCPVTLGSKSGSLNPWWLTRLYGHPVYLCLDNDQAGDEGAARLLEQIPNARRVRVPKGKDINEYHLTEPLRAVWEWAEEIRNGT